jgi:hypoxanthine phosphoribosyltransferase
VDAEDIEADLEKVLLSDSEIQSRLYEMAADIERDYEGRDLLLVGCSRVPSWSWPTSHEH